MFVDDYKSALDPELFKVLFEKDYKSRDGYHRINQDFSSELETRNSYRGREILEMLQNAEDQESSYFYISVNTVAKTICFYNGGIPFNKKGFDSILYAKTSQKQGNLSSIGNKGLGFRSILNWAESVDIYSRHTHFSFSNEIAVKKWDELREFFVKEGFAYNIDEIIENENKERTKNQDITVPISVFAVPDVNAYSELPTEFSECSKEIASVIRVKYKEKLQSQIINQIKALSRETLLFLRRIEEIVIKIDDERTIICKKLQKNVLEWNDGKIYEYKITKGEDESGCYLVYVKDGIYKESEKEIKKYTEEDNYHNYKLVKETIIEKYQLGIAIITDFGDGVAKPKKFPLYSFFETQIETCLPCILHGSFNLSPDRKYLLDEKDNQEGQDYQKEKPYNNDLLEKLGESFVQFVEFFAQKRQKEGIVDWLPYDQLVVLKKESLLGSLSLFQKTVESKLSNATIYPSIVNGYCKLDNCVAYSESFAKLIQENSSYFETSLGKHLLQGFSERAIEKKIDESFISNVNELSQLINERFENDAQVDNCYKNRIALIDCLCEIYRETRYAGSELKILTDENRNLLLGSVDNRLYVNTGKQLVNPPSILHFQYIDKNLVSALRVKWNHLLQKNVSEERIIADILQNQLGQSYVSAADISAIRQKVVNILHKTPSLADFQDIIKCLYATYQIYPELKFLEMETESGLSYYYDESNKYKDGAKEKVKELMMLGADGNYHSSMSLILYDKEFPHGFEKTYPIRIGNCWKLWGSFEDWKRIFDEPSAEKIENFFVKMLGVALYVPLKLVGLPGDDLIDNNNFDKSIFGGPIYNDYHYISYYVSYNDKRKEFYNLAFCPQENFLQELVEYVFGENLLILLLKSEYIYKSFRQKTINYRYGNSATAPEPLKKSFLACFLKSTKSVNQIAGAFSFVNRVIVENETKIVDLIQKESGRLRENIEDVLIQLGASRSINDLTIPALYNRLNEVTDKFNKGENISIQSEYHKIRDCIWEKCGNNTSDKRIQKGLEGVKQLVATLQGQTKVFPREEVYYWDNDKLPQVVLSKLPKLPLPSKVGEDSVEKIFGIKRVNGIEIEISNNAIQNESCKKSLEEALQKRFKYFLAKRCSKENGKLRDCAKALNGLINKIEVYSSCSYRLKSEPNYVEANEGDLLRNGDKFVLCSCSNSFEDSISHPHFCDSLIEILCINLEVKFKEWFGRFREILKNSINENEYYYEGEFIDPSFKNAVSNALGVSEEKVKFWNKIFSLKHLSQPIDESDVFFATINELFSVFRDEYSKVDYLKWKTQESRILLEKILKKCTAEEQLDVLKDVDLRDMHSICYKNKLECYQELFFCRLWEKCNEKKDLRTLYLQRRREYEELKNSDAFYGAVDCNPHKFDVDYSKNIADYVNEKFEIDLTKPEKEILEKNRRNKQIYEDNFNKILREMDFVTKDDLEDFLSNQIEYRSLLYFEIPEDIEQQIKDYLKKDEKSDTPPTPDDGPTGTQKVILNPVPPGSSHGARHKSTKTRKFFKRKNEKDADIGKAAERLAYKELRKKYGDKLIWHSENSDIQSDKDNPPTDGTVCDMWVQNSSDGEKYFEVKSLSDSFEMSISEYVSMMSHMDSYFVILADRSKRKISYHKYEDIDKLKSISSYIFKFKKSVEN